MADELVNPELPQNRQSSGFRGPSPDVGKDTQFRPGKSGNPGGKPKRKWLTEAFEEMLERKLADPVAREAFIQAQWEKLLSKTVVSSMLLEKMLDRTEGKLTQPVDVSGQIDIGSIIAEFREKD